MLIKEPTHSEGLFPLIFEFHPLLCYVLQYLFSVCSESTILRAIKLNDYEYNMDINSNMLMGNTRM